MFVMRTSAMYSQMARAHRTYGFASTLPHLKKNKSKPDITGPASRDNKSSFLSSLANPNFNESYTIK